MKKKALLVVVALLVCGASQAGERHTVEPVSCFAVAGGNSQLYRSCMGIYYRPWV